jgi:murein DD-endopeptidase MepM/ murein hydrolase activator NlpD
MSPFQLITHFSPNRLLHFVSFAFLIVLIVPIIAVIILANTGINLVSDTLIHVDYTTHTIELFDPKGVKIKDLKVDTSWPVKGIVTLEFGAIDLPYQPLHTGIDIANPHGQIGDNISSLLPGKITYAEELSWGYGKHIIIDHGDNITTLYAHLSQINVTTGQDVKSGQVIGQEGSTGWSTGPHLHFEVRVFGIPVNPRTFLGPST